MGDEEEESNNKPAYKLVLLDNSVNAWRDSSCTAPRHVVVPDTFADSGDGEMEIVLLGSAPHLHGRADIGGHLATIKCPALL